MNTKFRPRSRRIVVRQSEIHGKGVFATIHIPEGTRLIEYKGELITGEECESVYADASTHTFLFMIDGNKVIDGRQNGNSARWINHNCTPNCEAIEDDGRIFIETVRGVEAGEEITIDYSLHVEERHTETLKRKYACGCGVAECRGTMLDIAQ